MPTRSTWLRNRVSRKFQKQAARARWRKLQHETLEVRLAPAGSISGIVFNDIDGDTQYEPGLGETTIIGRTILLDTNGNNVFDVGERTELSDGTGSYLFSGVPNGIHRVRLIPEPGSEQSLPELRLTTHAFSPLPTIITPQANLQTTVDHVFDPTRGLHYISTNDGQILRLDVRTMEFLPPFDVGIQLGGIDITADGSAIYVAEQEPGTTQSIIRKVDPESGAVTNLTFDRVGSEAGAYDLAILNNGKAIFTTNYRGTGFTPVREINLTTDTIAVRADSLGLGPGGTVPGSTRIGRTGNRLHGIFRLDTQIDPYFEYHASSDTFSLPLTYPNDNAVSGVAYDPLRFDPNWSDVSYTLTSSQLPSPADNTFNRIYQRIHEDTFLVNRQSANASQPFGGSGQQTAGFIVPFGITAATVSWFDRLQSFDTTVDPNDQNFRVRLLNQFGNPVRDIYSANVVQLGPNYRSFDLTSALQSLAGQQIFLSFQVTAFNAAYDVNLEDILLHVSISNTTGFIQPIFETLANGIFYQTAMSPDGDELFLSTTTGLHVYTPTPTNWILTVNDNANTDYDFGSRPVNNYAPQAADDFYDTNGTQFLTVNAANGILKNDREANLNQSITIQLITNVQHGSLTLNPNGSFTYTGNPVGGANPFVDTDSFSYQLSDGITTSNVATVLITKNPNTGSSLSGLEFNDFDADGIFEPGLGETVAADVKVFLDLNDNGVLDPASEPQTLSAADGTWSFTGLTARDYRVRQILPNGARSTWPIASSASTLIVQAGVTDISFDTSRQILYIAAGNDTIRRYSLVARAFLSPIVVGGAAIGLDITPDNSTLYVADSLEVANKAFVRKVNLANGTVTTLQFDTPGTETGCFDISIGANGKALITTTSSDASPVPLRELDLATGTITIRADAPTAAGGGLVGSGTRIFRGTDRSRLLLTEGTNATGPLFTYISATGLFVDGPSTAAVTNTRHSAVSRDGQLIVSDIFGPSLMDENFQVQEIFERFDGGLGFDGTRDVFYAVDSFTDELVAYNVQNFQELLRVSIGENVGGLFYGQIGVIPDGQNLFLTTVSGVRAFDIGTSQGYLVTLANNASVDGLLFGNVTVPLSIHVAVPGGVMAENQGAGPLTGTVSRTGGDLTIPLVVTLTSSDTTEASMAATVTILAGQTSVNFPINAVDDNLLDGTQQVSITASAAPYGSDSDSIVVTDHELIIVSLASHSLPEVGGQTVATISRSNTDNSLALLVTLTSSDTTEATIQPSVTIPAGQASTTVTLNAVDDLLFDGTRQAVITGSAAAYFSLSDIVNIVSNADPYRNLLISTNASPDNPRLYEYSPSGTRVNDTSIQPVAGGDYPTRDLVVDASGKVHIFAGTAEPSLTTIDALGGPRIDTTESGWSTAAAGGTGGVARFGQYVFVTDMATGSGADLQNGLIRFDTTTGPFTPVRFGGSLDYTDVAVGGDGLLYGLAAGQLEVYNPETRAFIRTVTLPGLNTPVGIAVNSTGEILAVAGNNTIYRYDSSGVLIRSVVTTGASLSDIDLSAEGGLIASGLTGDVVVLDEALMDAPVKFSVSSTPAFVSFGSLRSAAGLTLFVSPTTFVESAGANAAIAIVSRPSEGSTAAALTVNLSSNDTSEASVPATVIIPAGKVSVTFAIAAVDDAVGDGPQNATITAAASGQASANTILTVTDDEFNYFTLSFAPTSMSELGGTLTGTVTRTVLDNSAPVTVNLASDDTTEATVPPTVLIPDGQNTANFTVTAVDDVLRDGTQTVNITASAAGIASGSGPVSVTDNEVDTISINIVAGSISENGGSSSGTVSRVFLNNSSALIVTLTSDDTTEATVPGTVTIPAGQTSVNFTVTGVNDSLRDGTQNVNITAAAPGVASVSDGLDVTDDEVDFLSLSFFPTSMSENGGTLTGTVTRNALNNLLPVVVTLNSGDATEASVPSPVTIPANENSVIFTVTAVDDALQDGTQTVTISASAGGFAAGNGQISVTDDEADTISISIVPGSISENGGTATGTVTRAFLNNSAALVVNLSSSDTGEASVPLSVTILANQNSRTFTVTGVNDALRDGTQTAVITASAAGVASTNANVSVTDDEIDTIAISLSTDLMSENGGSITGTVTRIDLDNSAALVVSLSSSDTGEATVPTTVTIPASQNSVTFAITAVDDALADRAQTVTITASAAGHASVNKNLIVSDDETPFQNPRHPLDVTADGFIVAGDVLAVINILNEIGTGAVGVIMPQYSGPPIFPDTSGDNFISALDALLVINYINDPPPPGGEGEFDDFSAFAPAAVPSASASASQVPAPDASAAALQALLADDSFWRQSKPRTPSPFEADSDWNQVVAVLARENVRRRGE
ncbi:MAG: dockerin type I domain-containing protein [Pirellulaceae bacterium]